jgi:hypothetical protein
MRINLLLQPRKPLNPLLLPRDAQSKRRLKGIRTIWKSKNRPLLLPRISRLFSTSGNLVIDLPDGPGCLGHNVLQTSWYFGNDLVYANPPWELGEQVIAKIKRDQVQRCILILPFRNQTLDKMSIAPAMELNHSYDLFLPPSRQGNGRSGVGLPRWEKTWAYLVSGALKSKTKPAIHKSGGPDSRFLFRCTMDGHHGVALADSGCTAMVVSEDYVRRFQLKTQLSSDDVQV